MPRNDLTGNAEPGAQSPLTHLGVVVPARDEEDLLADCLASVTAALAIVESTGMRTAVVVVADACTDRTASVAGAYGFEVVRVDVRSVGAARAIGTSRLLDRWADVPLDQVWIAHTDADGTVPSSWLWAHLEAASHHDALVGTVDLVDTDTDGSGVRASWLSDYVTGGAERQHGGHGHVHGANLGFRAAAYVRAGGFAPLPADEDRALVTALLSSGAHVAWVKHAPVVTSDRVVGRASAGFAAYLGGLTNPASVS